MTDLGDHAREVAVGHVESQPLVIELEQALHMLENTGTLADDIWEMLPHGLYEAHVDSVSVSTTPFVSLGSKAVIGDSDIATWSVYLVVKPREDHGVVFWPGCGERHQFESLDLNESVGAVLREYVDVHGAPRLVHAPSNGFPGWNVEAPHHPISRAAEGSRRGLEGGVQHTGVDEKLVLPIRPRLVLNGASSVTLLALDCEHAAEWRRVLVLKSLELIVESVCLNLSHIEVLRYVVLASGQKSRVGDSIPKSLCESVQTGPLERRMGSKLQCHVKRATLCNSCRYGRREEHCVGHVGHPVLRVQGSGLHDLPFVNARVPRWLALAASICAQNVGHGFQGLELASKLALVFENFDGFSNGVFVSRQRDA
uniref:Uncharacterized protein n=1 Tax=Fungal sp. (strain NRRL 50135) TaxID=1547289 RepID=A0A089FQH8_FUNXX|nr:hypothetical protein gNR595 [fungal sp. NRRL 50135]